MMAANFLLFLKVAVFEEGENIQQCFKTIDYYYVVLVRKMQESSFR